MYRSSRKRLVDPKAELGKAVMSYLGSEYRKPRAELEGEVKAGQSADRLFSWVNKRSESDEPMVRKSVKDKLPELRVSNLLSKSAAAGSPATLRAFVRGWQSFWGNPIAASLGLGVLPAAAYFGINKFTDPDSTSSPVVKVIANELVKADLEAGTQPRDADYYLSEAVKHKQRKRWRTALGVLVGSAALAHLANVNPSDWSTLYKYPEPRTSDGASGDTQNGSTSGVRHNASMLGANLSLTADQLRSAVLFDDRMSPEMKHDALRVIDFNPSNHMTSSDLVSNAMYSGVDARSGLPMGRIIASAAVDGAIGYGIGKLTGAAYPGRVAGLFGAGSALVNALKYVGSN